MSITTPPTEHRRAAPMPAETTPAVDMTESSWWWRRLMRDLALVFRATVIVHMLGAVTALLLRVLLDPATMGIWQAVKLLVGHGNYTNLGVSKGAAREYNVALGRGQTDEAVRGLGLALTVNTASSVGYAVLLVSVAVWIAIGTSPGGSIATIAHSLWSNPWCVAMLASGVLAIASRLVTFQITLLRVQQRFDVTTRVSIVEAVLTLVLGVALTWRFGLAGLYAATLLVWLAAGAMVFRATGIQLRPIWNWRLLRNLTAIGAPILLAGTASSLLRSLDKVMILAYMPDGTVALGLYSATLLIAAQLLGLGNLLATVVAPRLGEAYGRTGEMSTPARIAARASEWQAAVIALAVAMAMILGMPLLSWIIPRYAPGLPPLVYLAPGIVAMTLSLAPSQTLVAVGRQKTALWCVLVALAVAAAGNHIALTTGGGLCGVAGATSGTFLFYYLLVTGFGLLRPLDRHERTRYLAAMAGLVVPVLTIAVSLRLGRNVATLGIGTIALETAIVFIIWAITAAIAYRAGGWSRQFA